MNTCTAHLTRFSNPPPCKRNRAARMPCDPARSTPPMSDTAAHVLILDDDIDVACAAELLLRRRHGQVATLNDPAQLASLLASRVPDVVLLDLNFTPGRIDGAEGLAVLDLLRAQASPPAVIALTAYADVPLAVEALKRGASDFITKPWDNARLIAAVDSALARRAAGKLLAVDMGALPESTFESELFGHRKGSFTDARSDRAGRFQAARGGSLFLDEICNMPLAAQAKLLTALERREVTPLGADAPEAIDVRIISATNLDEARLFDAAVFRPDLLFRLNTIVIRVPPLRERREDIPALLRHYLDQYQRQYQRPERALGAAALAALTQYAWPGNVRALRHACERAVILGREAEYGINDFGLAAVGMTAIAAADAAHGYAVNDDDGASAVWSDAAGHTLDALERQAVAAALAQARGNISHAAKQLGVSRAALYRKLGKHGI